MAACESLVSSLAPGEITVGYRLHLQHTGDLHSGGVTQGLGLVLYLEVPVSPEWWALGPWLSCGCSAKITISASVAGELLGQGSSET